ncbi:hypothetical protein GCM10028796_12270 [Ramlibacter monticola]|uniref:Arsenate reductase n=1 Tax=Ramlibacter monticola TaxID=1926872 RepID=A0A937CS09_9BURK|nr:hypothetical protein [Ramlibacter monticola]MBL0390079.1 hypothetical protein [Ramlibacter monticola]
MPEVTIYQGPGCGTSGKTLAIVRHAGIEPEVFEYLKTPPTEAQLRKLLADADLSVRDLRLASWVTMPYCRSSVRYARRLGRRPSIGGLLRALAAIGQPVGPILGVEALPELLRDGDAHRGAQPGLCTFRRTRHRHLVAPESE